MTARIQEIFLAVTTAVGAFLGWYLGGVDGFVYTLLACAILDYLLGVCIAVMRRKLSSAAGFRGILKKVLMFALVGVGNLIDVYILQNGSAVRTAVIFFYIANEGISILENSATLGLPIPQKLRDILSQLKDKDGEE